MVVCNFFLQGKCRYGDQCRNEHPGVHAGASFRGGGGQGPLAGQQTSQAPSALAFNKESIQKDLTTDTPLWPLSSYGPAKGEPNLLSGTDYSMEELRLNFVEATKAGNPAAYPQQTLFSQVQQQVNNLLSNLDQAMAVATAQSPFPTQSPSQPSGPGFGTTFGMPAPNAFARPGATAGGFASFANTSTNAFARNTTPAGTSAFASTAAVPPGAFGTTPGAPKPTAFGGAPAQPAFGQPAFGQPSFGQPSFGQPAFGQPSFGQPSFGQTGFGRPGLGQSGTGQPGPQSAFGQTGFGGSKAFSGGFGAFAKKTQATGFGAFGSPSPSGPGQTGPSGAGQPSAFAAFASPSQAQGPGFGAPQQQAPPAPITQPGFASFGAQPPSGFPATTLPPKPAAPAAAPGTVPAVASTSVTQPTGTASNDDWVANQPREEDLPPEWVQAFRAERFEWGHVPLCPPPISLRS